MICPFSPHWLLAVLGAGDALASQPFFVFFCAEMHPEERREAGGAVRGQAVAGLVPSAGPAGNGAESPVQVSF